MRSLATLSLTAALLLCLAAASAQGHTTYVGYSGAPGSHGRCAASCHGTSGGTIEISGFPTEYSPGEVYTVTISHASGVAIRQFNGSCRVGSGSDNAGVIAAGTGTATYNTSGETNGVHLSAQDQNSAAFQWTAPGAGTGEVTLYIAGHQGSYSGQNTTLTLSATEATTAVPDGGLEASAGVLQVRGNSPNPFRDRTTITYELARPAPVLLEIFDLTGRRVASFHGEMPAGSQRYVWSATNEPSGIYFCRIRAAGQAETRSLLVLK